MHSKSRCASRAVVGCLCSFYAHVVVRYGSEGVEPIVSSWDDLSFSNDANIVAFRVGRLPTSVDNRLPDPPISVSFSKWIYLFG